jgi:hypothetical protein
MRQIYACVPLGLAHIEKASNVVEARHSAILSQTSAKVSGSSVSTHSRSLNSVSGAERQHAARMRQ